MKITDNGTLVTLGLIGVVAAAGAVSRRGSAASTKQDIRGWLQNRLRALPLPPGSNAKVLYATIESYEIDGEPQEALEYELGGYTNLNYHSTLSGYHESDLHDIVKDALGMREVEVEYAGVDWSPEDGHSVRWWGTIYADGDALSRRVRA